MRNISRNLRTPPIPQAVAGEYFTLCFNCVLVNLLKNLLPDHVQNEWNNIVLTLSPLDVFIKLMIISLNSKARSFANTNVQPIIMILHITHSEPVEWLCRFVNWNFGKYSRIMSSAQHIQWYESECVRLYKLAAIQFCSANNCYLFVGTLKKFPIHLHGASCMPYSHSLTEIHDKTELHHSNECAAGCEGIEWEMSWKSWKVLEKWISIAILPQHRNLGIQECSHANYVSSGFPTPCNAIEVTNSTSLIDSAKFTFAPLSTDRIFTWIIFLENEWASSKLNETF